MQSLQQHVSTFNKINRWLEDNDESAVAMAGLDEAAIGLHYDQKEGVYRLVYSAEAILDLLILGGMDDEEAVEHYHYNIEGSCIGGKSPILIQTKF